MAEPAGNCPQSAEAQVTVVSVNGGAIWQACLGGCCVRSGSGVRLMELLAAMLVSRGIRPPLR
jgi:hypothetical protein